MANIVITGANQGIGYFIVENLLRSGSKVAVLDIATDHLETIKSAYENSLLLYKVDVRNENDLKDAIKQVIAAFHNIDIAIHNACKCTFTSEADTALEVYRDVLDVNYFGALRLAKAVLPDMRRAGHGRVIFTSSGVGVTGFGNISPYASSKGAIESLAKCLEIENQCYGITFHVFHPPLTNTAAAAGLPIPAEFMADAAKVGKGLAKHIDSKKFVICHSFSQAVQMKLCYRHPLFMGKNMWKMTARAERSNEH